MSAGAPICAGLAKETRVSKSVYVRARLWCVLLLLGFATHSIAEGFRISDIRIEGLQRITAGTVFNYLPVKVGDLLTTGDSEAAMRALFRTGFFNDIYLEREGNVLVVNVKERAAISSIEITGNEDLETEALLEGLEQIGLSEGMVFYRSLLDKVDQELQRPPVLLATGFFQFGGNPCVRRIGFRKLGYRFV